MTTEPNEITDTADIAERNWDGESEPDDKGADLSATHKPTEDRIQFHVQMRGYTMREMDNLMPMSIELALLASERSCRAAPIERY